MKGQIEVPQSSLICSIVILLPSCMAYPFLSHSCFLLTNGIAQILGICFLTVDYDKINLNFNAFVTKTVVSLMMASSISLFLPTTILSTLL
jgi:hypothetical protein